jgi:hypothetical protein
VCLCVCVSVSVSVSVSVCVCLSRVCVRGGSGVHQVKSDDPCQGDQFDDSSPFDDLPLPPPGDGRATYSMRELTELLHPRNVQLPFVYADVTYWGHAKWRPSPTYKSRRA